MLCETPVASAKFGVPNFSAIRQQSGGFQAEAVLSMNYMILSPLFEHVTLISDSLKVGSPSIYDLRQVSRKALYPHARHVDKGAVCNTTRKLAVIPPVRLILYVRTP